MHAFRLDSSLEAEERLYQSMQGQGPLPLHHSTPRYWLQEEAVAVVLELEPMQ